ncbi:MAG: PEGA domain-containing protein [Planctomycetota bacterium]
MILTWFAATGCEGRVVVRLLSLIFCVMCILPEATAAEHNQELADAVRLLHESRSDRSKIFEAARRLARVAATLPADSPALTGINSMLYWLKKTMTVDEARRFAASNATAARKATEIAERKVNQADASVWLSAADEYAKRTTDSFLKAIRYFEVADRFKGTPESLVAQEKSLSLMREFKSDASQGGSRDPVGKATIGRGRVFVQSKPKGARILVVEKDGIRDTGRRTPSMIRPNMGRVEIVLRKDGYEDKSTVLTLGEAIIKTEEIVLSEFVVDVDIVTEVAGWYVLVDGAVGRDAGGLPVRAPCTLGLRPGLRALTLVKDGYVDRRQKVTVKGDGLRQTVRFAGKARRGRGSAWKVLLMLIEGRWQLEYTNGATRVYVVKNGICTSQRRTARLMPVGPGVIRLQFGDGKTELLRIEGATLSVEHYHPSAKVRTGVPTWTAVGTRIE